MGKVKPPKQKGSLISNAFNQKRSKADLEKDNFLNFSFRHLDPTQGSTLEQWSESGMLLHAVNSIKNICSSTLKSHIGTGVVAIYGNFPQNSAFKPPTYVPEDADWGRIHINGTNILAGHFVSDTFYVVFLDDSHSFYITYKKNT